MRYPQPASGTIVHDPERGVLLLWRHRFITDTWGWEIPAGRIERRRDPRAGRAPARRSRRRAGARGRSTRLGSYAPINGSSDQIFHVFVADGASHEGDPSDIGESERIEWVPVGDVRRLIADGGLTDGLSLTALLWALAFDRI